MIPDGRAPRAPWRITTAVALAALVIPQPARAEPADDPLARVRALYDRGEFAQARDELLAAYRVQPRPELLFALGQVELHLDHFAAAIDYYERFIATNPASDQAALAQQAIGAARARLVDRPVPAAPPRVLERRWDDLDTGLAAIGGAAVLVGTGLVIYSARAGDDHSGTLSAYNSRLSRATTAGWAGAGGIVAGLALAGSAVLRWRYHLVETELRPIATPTSAGAMWIGRW